MSVHHPAYDRAPAALRWPTDGDPRELWSVLNAALAELPAGAWAARVLTTGTVVTLRLVGVTRELRIQRPAMPRSQRLEQMMHCRWSNEVDELRTAFGIRGWDKLETDGESVHYVDRPRVGNAAPEPVVSAAPAAAVPVLQARAEQVGLVLQEVAGG